MTHAEFFVTSPDDISAVSRADGGLIIGPQDPEPSGEQVTEGSPPNFTESPQLVKKSAAVPMSVKNSNL